MVLAHEKTGLLFEPTDVTQMAQQISRVLANPELSYSLGQAARKFVCANFDIHQLLNQETALLQAIGETNEPKTS
jgi:glycosyltransferase involved in cell wall biosynthesis